MKNKFFCLWNCECLRLDHKEEFFKGVIQESGHNIKVEDVQSKHNWESNDHPQGRLMNYRCKGLVKVESCLLFKFLSDKMRFQSDLTGIDPWFNAKYPFTYVKGHHYQGSGVRS